MTHAATESLLRARTAHAVACRALSSVAHQQPGSRLPQAQRSDPCPDDKPAASVVEVLGVSMIKTIYGVFKVTENGSILVIAYESDEEAELQKKLFNEVTNDEFSVEPIRLKEE